MQRWLVPFVAAFATASVAFAAAPPDALWQPFDRLGEGDRSLAQGALADMFGDDPDLWPDWLDPRAVLIPAGRGNLLVVREPYRASCGQYQFIVFGPVTADGTRGRLGTSFCAGDLVIAPMSGRTLPDLLFSEGRVLQTDGSWQRQDQRVRWTGQGWVKIVSR